MPNIEFNRYYRYTELTDLLRAYEQEYPDLVRLESIGHSYEGRDIWLVTVTDFTTCSDQDKPAFWCDGNIHASEVSASTAVLHLLNRLVSGAHADVLKDRAFYLVPRLGPDGAEWALEDPPRIIRSSTRPYPFDEEDPYGLERQDIDHDGRILQMRVPDPTGPWKVCDLEPRLMQRRDPGEMGGTYYRLLSEGVLHNFDGLTMRMRKTPQGLDMNRNFPNGWRQEHEQHGAGPFPTSEPEIRAAVAAITSRQNICGAVTFHTFSGVHLRPSSTKADEALPAEDIWAYREIGKKGEEMTGYPALSVFHDFRYHPKEVITGVFDDWMYEQCGVYAWTTEIWSPMKQAGIEDFKPIDWFREHPIDDDIKMLRWNDEKLGGEGYVDWYPFDHPQLGPVEIGGWDMAYAWRNPPLDYLEKEVAPLGEWVIWQSQCGPKLSLRATIVDVLEGAWRIRVAIENVGWLPTNVTKMAAEKNLCRGVVGEIEGDGDLNRWLLSGLKRQDIGQLGGYSHVGVGQPIGWEGYGSDNIGVLEWVVNKPGLYTITVQHQRAGKLTTEVAL